MDDLRTLLRDKADEMRLDPEMPADLRARAHRRRVGTAVLGGVVILSVGVAAFVGARELVDRERPGPRPLTPAPVSDGTLPIWPFGKAEDIDRIQQAVDEGHQPWYMSPEIVAQVFAMDVLGWDREDTEASVRGDEPVQVAIANPSLAQKAGAETDIRTILTMEPWRGREDGIFVITRAKSDIVHLDSPVPGQNVDESREIHFAGTVSAELPDFKLQMVIAHLVLGHEDAPLELRPLAGAVTDASAQFDATVEIHTGIPEWLSAAVFLHGRTLSGPSLPPLGVVAFRLGSATPQVQGDETTSEEDVRRFVDAFVKARRSGAAAEGYLSPEAASQYEADRADRLSLYEPPAGFFPAGYELLALEPIDANSYEVVLLLIFSSAVGEKDEFVTERLFVGPGHDVEGEPLPLVIRGVQLEGPSPELPEAVAATRLAILSAAHRAELEKLRPLIPEKGFTFSFGGTKDPITYWQDLENQGEPVLDILVTLLEGEPAKFRGIYAWPAPSVKAPEDWTDEDLVILRAVSTDREIRLYREYGSYLGWRVGIEPDGDWIFFVAGD